MARGATEAQRIEQANEQSALAFFQEALRGLPDPRRRRGTRYPLTSVVVIALMAMVCGADDAEAMQAWGEAQAEWLGGLLELPHGTPTQDVFLAVFAALDPVAFRTVFLSWMDLLRQGLSSNGKQICLDGKTSRRSMDIASGKVPIHTVSAWLAEEGLVLGQVKVDDKSNEITAIPEVLRVLDLRGATVTVDALGCQTEIAKTIVDAGGHYQLAVKDNQPALRQDLECTFTEAADPRPRSVDEQPRPVVQVFEETDKGHGRIERRRVSVCRDLSWMQSAERWKGLDHLIQVTRERTVLSTGKTSTETAYCIGSNPCATALDAARCARRHWSIENELHWVLDMGFREDEARHRARHTAQNFTTLRHFALNLLKRDSGRKLGIANSRRRAGWNRDYLLGVLTAELT